MASKAEGLRRIENETRVVMVLHGLSLAEVLTHLESVLQEDLDPNVAPLSPEGLELLHRVGMDQEQYQACSRQDGGVAYRALQARRSRKKGAAA